MQPPVKNSGLLSIGVLWLLTLSVLPGEIVITELMYNAGKKNLREDFEAEFVEITNTGDQAVSLKDWRFDKGIAFTFSERTLQPGEIVVVAARPETLAARHPDLAAESVLGPYTGKLSNSGERLRLVTAEGIEVDDIRYSDEGRWSRRVLLQENGFNTWEWDSPHSGKGYSLELIQSELPNEFGHNWSGSTVSGGTPGKPNSQTTNDSAPLIRFNGHSPATPTSTESVTVRAIVVDESEPLNSVHVEYRIAGTREFTEVPMSAVPDNPDHWKAQLPPTPSETVVEFRIVASDKSDQTRICPTPTQDKTVGATFRYMVDDKWRETIKTTGAPVYRLILTPEESQLLREISDASAHDNIFNNHFSVTFVAWDGERHHVRHEADIRIRGNGSRSAFPPGLRLHFPNGREWKGISDINLNSQYVHSQILGAALYQAGGFAAARAHRVQLWMSHEDWTLKASKQFGYYTHNEVLNQNYVDFHFPGEESGNLYRGINRANLNDPDDSLESLAVLYNKRNHKSIGDYSGIRQLLQALDKSHLPESEYLEQLELIIDLDQWMSYFAFDALACNIEGGLPTGRGDDFALFRRKDGRFHLIPYDLDSILGLGERGVELRKGVYDYGNVPGLQYLFKQPRVIRLYQHHLNHWRSTFFQTEKIQPLVESKLADWVPKRERQKIVDFISARNSVVTSQVNAPPMLGSSLPRDRDWHVHTKGGFLTFGRYEPGRTASVLVNGQQASLNPRTCSWLAKLNGLEFHPGYNRIWARGFDPSGAVTTEDHLRLWKKPDEVKTITSLPNQTEIHWNSEEGPYHIQGSLIVPRNTTLYIDAGTTVILENNTRLLVRGTIVAKGTEESPVYIGPQPGGTHWGGVLFQSSIGNRLRFVQFKNVKSPGGVFRVVDSELKMQHCHFADLESPLLNATTSTIHVDGTTVNDALTKDGLLQIDSSGSGPVIVENSRFTGIRGPLLKSKGRIWWHANRHEAGDAVLRINGGQAIVSHNKTGKNSTLSTLTGSGAKVRSFGSTADHQTNTEALEVYQARQANNHPILCLRFPGIVSWRHNINGGPWIDHACDPFLSDPTAYTLEGITVENTVNIEATLLNGTVLKTKNVRIQNNGLQISEILADNNGSFDLDGRSPDCIELFNDSPHPIPLDGYRLTDSPDRPSRHIFSGAGHIDPYAYRVFSLGDNEQIPFGLSKRGETLELRASDDDTPVDSVTFGRQLPGHSISRKENGNWRLSRPTLGEANRFLSVGDISNVRITECFAAEDWENPQRGSDMDYVELQNTGVDAVNLKGAALALGWNKTNGEHRFPPETYIAGGERLIFSTWPDGSYIRLDREGGVAQLVKDEIIVDTMIWNWTPLGLSTVRGENQAVTIGFPTPGKNDSAPDNKTSPNLVISEIHYNPLGLASKEFIELLNISDTTLPLAGYSISGGIRFAFSDGELAPGERLVVTRNAETFRSFYGDTVRVAGSYTGKLSNKSDFIELRDGSGDVFLRVRYADDWHPATDGTGPSLQVVDPRAKAENWSQQNQWKPSTNPGGTPGE